MFSEGHLACTSAMMVFGMPMKHSEPRANIKIIETTKSNTKLEDGGESNLEVIGTSQETH